MLASILMLTAFLGQPAGLTLARDGQTGYAIVTAPAPSPTEHTATLELQEHLRLVTGAIMPVRELGAEKPDHVIAVGTAQALAGAFPGAIPALPPDGVLIKTVGDNLILTGGSPRAVLHAVYTFLEDEVGCHWWTATENTIPNLPTLAIPALDKTYTPALTYREAFYRGAFDGVFAARLRLTGNHHRIAPEYGGHYSILGWCHTFYPLLPPEEHFATHPEWYSEIGGKRTADRAQLCLTNEECRKALTAKAMEWLRAAPDAGMISISQNDWLGKCECASCKSLEEEEGAASGPLLHFVNAVADDIKVEFPNALVETLAYQYTRQAPRFARPRNNVVIRLCTIECSFLQPLVEGGKNQSFVDDINAWSKQAGKLFIWDYVTNFSNFLIPHPNLNVLEPNIRLFVDKGTVGLFEQGDVGSSCGDFVEMRAWVLAHLMWDPSLNARALMDEFLAGYYGPAAPAIRNYLDLLQTRAESTGIHLGCFHDKNTDWLDFETISAAVQLMDEASAAAANDAVFADRTSRARMPIDLSVIIDNKRIRRWAEQNNKPFMTQEDTAALAKSYLERASRFDIGQYREGQLFTQYEPRIRARVEAMSPAKAPEIIAASSDTKWTDYQEYDFTLAYEGEWTSREDDPTASNGAAVRMPSNHIQWAVQCPFDEGEGEVSCYISLRAKGSNPEARAVMCGIWDAKENRNIIERAVMLKDCADGYVEIPLGKATPHGAMYVWVAPCNNPDDVESVWVDRVFTTRDEKR